MPRVGERNSSAYNLFYFILKNLHKFLCSSYLLSVEKIQIHNIHHGTIMRTGIACKKITCYMRDLACRWLILKNFETFRSYVKHF